MADDFQRRSSSSRKSSAREDKPASRSSTHHEEGSANGKEGGGGGGGGGGAAKKKFGVAQILAIVALIITLVAVGLSIWCSLLWWDWPFVITIPALSLAIAALVLAFVAPSHFDAILCCSVLGLIFGLAGLIWCAVEIGFCHSNQGKLMSPDEYKSFTDRLKDVKGDYNIAYFWHGIGSYCKGECYDWWYRKEILTLRTNCERDSEKWFMKNHFKKGSLYKYCDSTSYEGTDSYSDSPIYQTHMAIAEYNQQVYPDSGDFSLSKRKKALKDFCKDFNVDKFVKQRKKCDKKLKKKFEPGCSNVNHGIRFKKGTKSELIEVKDCNDDEKPQVFTESKFVKAMNSPKAPSNEPQFIDPKAAVTPIPRSFGCVDIVSPVGN